MSGQKQLHFGNPQNYFWKGLFQSGLIPRSIAPEEGHLLWTSWNMSIVNLVQRTTPSASDLSRQEMRDAVPDLCRKISESAPRIVCFVGIGIYATFAAQSNTTPGLQPVVYSLEPAASGADKSTATSSNAQQPPLQPLTPDKTAHQGMLGARPPFAYLFVMPSTSGRTTTYQNRDKLMFLKQLKYVRDCVAPASPESPPRPIDHDVLDDLGPKTRSKYF
ncbi:uracil DNA N-glycosylase Thp1 [Coemansia sp. RSA 2322]|uniref:Uracil DNA N-glycosylase Thp1 n=1 Tax=Coemansia thaxteri TaxID=2663907 RepID=A0A9W8EKF0_9FUNG|nr:uracil DNA N-glycosylase Thp1 [Coemansia thaxteri]KAJ2464096.1 uracil DNA N-glycosylase Thp1 [Coemansia sp. RSA 2322]